MSDLVEGLMRPDVAGMASYVPILPFDVLSKQLGRPVEQLTKLDANENPYGPSPLARRSLAELPFAHIYPDPESRELRAALEGYTGLPAEFLLAGAGADELIDLVMRLFLLPGDAIINCPPTFGMYAFDAGVVGARVVAVGRTPDFRVNVEAIERASRTTTDVKLLFVTSPNNPDGGLLTGEDLDRLLALPLVVVLDEAYIEFAGLENSFIHLVPKTENLIVLRTFSKWAGLAGLRLGYGAFPLSIIGHLWKIKQPYNVSVAAQAAGLASLEDRKFLHANVDRIRRERSRMADGLADIRCLHPYPSRSNFILCRVANRSARELKQRLAGEGVLARHYDTPGLLDHIRFSVGLPEHTDRLLAVLHQMEDEDGPTT